jgi:integrase
LIQSGDARRIRLLPQEAIVITPLLEKALREAWVTHRESEYELVFATGKGTPLDPPTLRKRHFLRALHRSGLRQVRFHDLRHTYAALMISQGENLKFIQSQLGHASIQTTLDRYGHLLPGVSAGVGMRLDESVFGESVSKMLAESPSLDSPQVGEPPESFISQGISQAARPRG